MWYDLNSEAGVFLSAGTTYFDQCYAIQNGKEVRGSISSFTTESDNSGCQYQQAGQIRLPQIMQPSEVQRHIRVHVRVKSDYISEHRRII